MTSFRTASLFVLGATGLAAVAVWLWPASQEEEPLAVPSSAVASAPPGAGGERESPPPVPDQGVQRAIVVAEHVAARVEPAPAAPDAAVVVSWDDAYLQRNLDELRALDRTIRTPRPFVSGCLTLPPTAFACRYNWPLLTEGVDPEWSHAAEERLTAIWEDNVKGISNDFVFVMCKTTLCQVNYRFPTGTDDVGRDRPFSLFLKGFRVSELASELHVGCISYSGIVVAVEFERNFPQAGPQPTEQSRRPCRSLDKPGP